VGGNSRWYRSEDADPGAVEALIDEIDQDPTGTFWG